jgi:hypothetical protein
MSAADGLSNLLLYLQHHKNMLIDMPSLQSSQYLAPGPCLPRARVLLAAYSSCNACHDSRQLPVEVEASPSLGFGLGSGEEHSDPQQEG